MRVVAALVGALYLTHILTGGLDRIVEPPVTDPANPVYIGPAVR